MTQSMHDCVLCSCTFACFWQLWGGSCLQAAYYASQYTSAGVWAGWAGWTCRIDRPTQTYGTDLSFRNWAWSGNTASAARTCTVWWVWSQIGASPKCQFAANPLRALNSCTCNARWVQLHEAFLGASYAWNIENGHGADKLLGCAPGIM